MRTKSKTDPLKGAPAKVVAAFKRLSEKRKAFALAMPTADSQKHAARLAGYSEKTAQSLAFKLLKDPDVKAVVDYLSKGSMEQAAEVVVHAKDSVERTVAELCRVALVDPRELFDDVGRLLPIHDWPEDVARAVSSIESFEEYQGRGEDREAIGMVRKVKFHSKIEGIDKLARIRGFYRPDQHEHTHRVHGLGELLDEIDGAGTGPGPSTG